MFFSLKTFEAIEVVNDLASVNIDSQLLRRYDDGDMQLVELQNGVHSRLLMCSELRLCLLFLRG